MAILGVPRERFAISLAASGAIQIPKILLERFTIFSRSSGEYSSKRSTIPKRSRSGVVKEPALVVAPIKVNFGKSKRMDLALGPYPIIISSV